MSYFKVLKRLTVAMSTSLAVVSSNAATINLIDLGGVTGSAAEVDFRIAANYWGNLFSNNVTINLGVGYTALPSNVIGSTLSNRQDYSVTSWEAAVNATKSNSFIDQNAALPTLINSGVSGNSTGRNSSGYSSTNVTELLNGTQLSSQVLWENTALIKALGGNVDSSVMSGRDGDVTFSNKFAFDFDPTNGISAGMMDFLGVALHEIGHALGFVSGVDIIDYNSRPKGNYFYGDVNNYSLFSALDMFRYSTVGTLDFRPGIATYFSIDNGANALMSNNFATGRYNGDGGQASHWKDSVGCSSQLGVMDPTFCFGQMGEITSLDLAAFDAMGWNLSIDALNYQTKTTAEIYADATSIPEPATIAIMVLGLAGMGASLRKTKKKTPN